MQALTVKKFPSSIHMFLHVLQHITRTTTLMVQTKCCRQCPEQAQADGHASSKTQTAEAPKASVSFAPLEEGLHGNKKSRSPNCPSNAARELGHPTTPRGMRLAKA